MLAELQSTQSGDYYCAEVAYQRPDKRPCPSRLFPAALALSIKAPTPGPWYVAAWECTRLTTNLPSPLQYIKQKQHKTGHPQPQSKEEGKQAQAGFLTSNIVHSTLASIQVGRLPNISLLNSSLHFLSTSFLRIITVVALPSSAVVGSAKKKKKVTLFHDPPPFPPSLLPPKQPTLLSIAYTSLRRF